MESHKKTVLIIETSAIWQNRIRYRFEQEGFVVDIASTFEEASRKLKEKRFAIITLDMTLSGNEEDALGVLLLAEATRANIYIPPTMIISESIHVASIVEAWNHYPIFFHTIKSRWIEIARHDFQEALDRVLTRRKEDNQTSTRTVVSKKTIFVSKSFHPKDKKFNEFIEDIIRSLRINYVTGEPYTTGSIPENIKVKISENNVFLGIWVPDRLNDNTKLDRTRTYLTGEVEYADGLGKPIILVVQEGITQLGLFGSDRRHIPLSLNSSAKMRKATLELLQAFKYHEII